MKKIMKIAQVTATFPPYMAGTGNVCYQISLELAKRGHDITVYTSRFLDKSYNYPNCIKVMRYKPLFKIGSSPLILELLKLRNFDIIHLHYPFFFGGEMVYIVSKLFNQKYVITYHNDVVDSAIHSTVIKSCFKLYKKSFFKLVIKNAHKIIVPSMDFAKNSNLKDIKGINHLLVEIPNCVDSRKFHPNIDCSDIVTKYELKDKQVLLFVRALDEAHFHCGLEYLLSSFAKLNSQTTVLLIIGDGGLKNYYQKMSEKLGISNKVFFLGSIPNEKLPKYYSASDILILPSAETENCPLVLLEAFSCAKPVITSNLPGVRKLVNDNIDGLLVKPKDIDDLTLKIQYLLDNSVLIRKLGASGRVKIENNYSLESTSKKLEEIYTS